MAYKNRNHLDELILKIDRFIVRHQELQLDSFKIKTIMDMFKHWRACHTKKKKSFCRKVLYFILERMFWSAFEDSYYVSQLLRLLYETDGQLYCAMVPNSEKCPSLIAVNQYEFHEYFLKHAYQQKTLFDGYRFPCTEVYAFSSWQHPIEMAASIPDPVLLHQMLRYGALLSYDRNYKHCYKRRYRYGYTGLMALISIMSRIVGVNPNMLPIDVLDLDPEEKEIYAKDARCCELLMCDFPQWTPAFINNIKFSREFPWKRKDYLSVFHRLSMNVVPHFNKHFTVPMDLKQYCRLTIRRILNEKCLLPQAIASLPIPECLKEYIDLRYN